MLGLAGQMFINCGLCPIRNFATTRCSLVAPSAPPANISVNDVVADPKTAYARSRLRPDDPDTLVLAGAGHVNVHRVSVDMLRVFCPADAGIVRRAPISRCHANIADTERTERRRDTVAEFALVTVFTCEPNVCATRSVDIERHIGWWL